MYYGKFCVAAPADNTGIVTTESIVSVHERFTEAGGNLKKHTITAYASHFPHFRLTHINSHKKCTRSRTYVHVRRSVLWIIPNLGNPLLPLQIA